MTEHLINIFTNIISTGGYSGLAFLMTLESMVAPVPSEAVMPFAGFLWYSGKMSLWPIIAFSTLGSIIGSLISYYIGDYGGRPLVKKFGRYLLLNEHHLELTENFFNKYGGKTIFISRFIPIIRHLISLPAGVAKMNIFKFSLYTIVGAGLWNAFLAYLGYYLGSNWSVIRQYGEVIDKILLAIIVVVIIYFIHWKRRRRTITQSTDQTKN
ncbi:MAG: DedA family protein [Patescibacteria group bacterium]